MSFSASLSLVDLPTSMSGRSPNQPHGGHGLLGTCGDGRRRNASPLVSGIRRVFVAVVCIGVSCGIWSSAEGQVTFQTLIGNAVSDDIHTEAVTNAISRFRDNDVDGCRAALERIRSQDEKLPPTGMMMARLWLGANQVPAARAELEDTVIKFPADPEAYLVFGDLAFQDRRITDASLLFGKAAELTASFTGNAKRQRDFQIRGHAGQAAVAEAQKDWEGAKEHVQAWVDLDPDSASARQRMGNVLFHLEKYDEALKEFAEAKTLDAKITQPELMMARLYDEAKEPDLARQSVEAAVKAAPEDLMVTLGAADWFLAHGDLDAARSTGEVALKLDPKSLDARIVNGTIARVSRDYATAELLFEEAHSQSPRNFPASNSLVLVLAESDDKDSLRRAVEMAETNVAMVKDTALQTPALITLAWTYYKTGKTAESENILGQIMQNNALTADGVFYVAQILFDKGETEKAKELLGRVLANQALFASRADAEALLAKLKAGSE